MTDETYDNLTINDTLIMKAPNQQDHIDLKTVWVTVPTAAPILKISQGMWGMKDFSCLGFLGSVSKTEIIFGDTYTNCVPTDIGKMVKDDGADTTVLASYDNEHKKWWLAGSTPVVASGSTITIVNGTGTGISSGNSSTGGGGAILMGHGLNDTSEPAKIILMDSALGFDTLYLKKFGGSDPAHLDVGKLTAASGAKLNAIAIGRDEYGDIPYEYESIQLNPVHNLRFCFGTNERMVLENAGILRLPVNGPSGGLKIGNDVTLYRSDQDVLKTDDNLIVGGSNLNINPSSGSSSLSLQIGGSTKAYFTHDGSKGYLSANGDLEINISGSNIRVMGSKYLLPENPNGGSIGNGTYYWGSINSNYMCLVGNQKYVYPLTANTGSCGTVGNYFYSTYANHFYGKQSHLFGCEIEKSDLPVERKFQTLESAEECLRHELTKEWKHTHYSESKPGKIICVCGKEADSPCPEHVDEWNDIYTLNLSDMTQASAMLVVKLLDEVADLRSQIDLLKSGEVKVD